MPPGVMGANVASPFMMDRTKANLAAQEFAELVQIQKKRNRERQKLWAKTPAGIASGRASSRKGNKKGKEARKGKREELGRKPV